MGRDSPRLRRIVRHDLRSPLAVVLGQCEVLEMELYGPLEDGQREAIASIVRQTERALKLLDEAGAMLAPHEDDSAL